MSRINISDPSTQHDYQTSLLSQSVHWATFLSSGRRSRSRHGTNHLATFEGEVGQIGL